MPTTRAVLSLLVLLLFTGSASVRADPARWPGRGAVVRAGTAVGLSEIGTETVTTLGGQLGVGYRLGPVEVAAEYESLAMLEYVEDEGTNADRGMLTRWGVTGRLFVVRIGRGASRDPDSILRLYVESGAGRQRGRWSTGDEFGRTDVSAGGGWLLDHRMRPRPAGLPFHSIGWQFGWRATAARADGDDVVFKPASCKGCKPPMPGPDVDLGLLVTCSLTASW